MSIIAANIKVVVTLQFEALHNWPGVVEALPEDPSIHFLQYPHRHVFHIRLEKSVKHQDRDVEIILLKRRVLDYLNHKFPDRNMGATSCEMLAWDIGSVFDCDCVEVLEDNENGGKIERKKLKS